MGRPVNSIFNAVSYYAIMTAMAKMGINPGLLSRRTSTALTPLMKQLAEGFLGRDVPKTLAEYFETEKMLLKIGGVCDTENMEVTFKDGTSTLKLSDCFLLEMTNFARSAGCKQCPVCIVGAITIGTLKAMNLGDMKDLKVERNGNTCTINLIAD
jgi:hypothetical protein